MRPKIRLAAAFTTAVVCLACADSLPPPNDQLAAAQADVGRAESGGAPVVPDAKLHLQLAEEDLQKSKQVMGEDNKRASTAIQLARR